MQVGNRTRSAHAFSRFRVEKRKMLAAEQIAFVAVKGRLIFIRKRLACVRAQIQISANHSVVTNEKTLKFFSILSKVKQVRNAILQMRCGD